MIKVGKMLLNCFATFAQKNLRSTEPQMSGLESIRKVFRLTFLTDSEKVNIVFILSKTGFIS